MTRSGWQVRPTLHLNHSSGCILSMLCVRLNFSFFFPVSRKGVPAHLRNVRSKLSKTFHENERYNFESTKGQRIFFFQNNKNKYSTSVAIQNGQKVGRFSIQLKVHASVFTTVLRHLYRILLKESILCLYVGSTLFIRAFPFSPHFDGHVLSEPCLTNISILDGDDSGVEDSQNSSISKKS